MKYFLFFLMLIAFVACNNADKSVIVVNDSLSTQKQNDTTLIQSDTAANYIHTFTDTVLENKIIAALLKLPFVIKSNNYIDSFSNHKHGIAFLLDEPAKNEKDISVQAGYNGAGRFETYYRFFVSPKTMEIKVYDPVEGEKLTLKEYLKTQK